MAALLNKITLSQCEKLSETEVLLRKIPHDNAAGHLPEILAAIKSGYAKVLDINLDGEKIGLVVYEIQRTNFHVLAILAAKKVILFENVWPIIKTIAKKNSCESATFNTVRAGLISQALLNNFYVSSVVMRTTL